jgi:hypothetical protein
MPSWRSYFVGSVQFCYEQIVNKVVKALINLPSCSNRDVCFVRRRTEESIIQNVFWEK